MNTRGLDCTSKGHIYCTFNSHCNSHRRTTSQRRISWISSCGKPSATGTVKGMASLDRFRHSLPARNPTGRWGLKRARETAAQNTARGGGGGKFSGGTGGGKKRPAVASASTTSSSKSPRRAVDNEEGKPTTNQVTQGRYRMQHPKSPTTINHYPAVATTDVACSARLPMPQSPSPSPPSNPTVPPAAIQSR